MKKLFNFFLFFFFFTGTLPFPGFSKTAEMLPISQLAIPTSLGKIETRFIGQSNRWVIHIQDVHAHLTAQQNIAAIIDLLRNTYGIKVVGIEGSWYASRFPKSWGLPPSREKLRLAQILLEEDYMNGSVYAAIFSKAPIGLVGIEKPELYDENGALYLKYLNQKESVMQKVSILQHKLQSAKENAYNPALLNFDRLLTDFRDGKKAEKFLPEALRLAKSFEISLENLPQIQLFEKTLDLEKSLDKAKMQNEATRLVKAYKHFYLPFEALLESGKVPEERLQLYPQISLYRQLQERQKQIQHNAFFQEVENLIALLKSKLIQTSAEAALDKRSEAAATARKIMLLQATPADVQNYKARADDFARDLLESDLEDALDVGLDFYEAAHRRDEVFFEKIMTNPKLKGDIAVVTGGFHTEGLQERLEKTGINYMIISPDLGKDETVNEELYIKRIRENLAANHAFSDLLPEALIKDGAFFIAARDLAQNRNEARAVEVYLTFQEGELAANLPRAESKISKNIDQISNKELAQTIKTANSGTQEVAAIIPLSKLMSHLRDLQHRQINHDSLSRFLENPNNKLIITHEGESAEIDDMLIGKRNVRMVQQAIDAVIAREKDKLSEKDTPLAVIAHEMASKDSRIVSIEETYAGLFEVVRLLVTDSRFSSSKVIHDLMERVLLIMQEAYKAASQSA